MLGSGTSTGVPVVGCGCAVCRSADPRNRRLRPGLRLELDQGTAVVDTSPDFREQSLRFGIDRVDAVLYTHPHADHIHGIDDLRGFALEQRRLMDVHADAATMVRLREAFGYCFETPAGSSYPPILMAWPIHHERPVIVEGEGGALAFEPLPQIHGDIVSLGFRIGNLAYCPDVSDFPDSTAERLYGLDTLIIDALQYRPHPSHLSLAQALEWIDRLKPRQAFLTHMHIPMDYETVLRETPGNVSPAHDGLVIEMTLNSI